MGLTCNNLSYLKGRLLPGGAPPAPGLRDGEYQVFTRNLAKPLRGNVVVVACAASCSTAHRKKSLVVAALGQAGKRVASSVGGDDLAFEWTRADGR